jgi:hypothetical protein
MTVIEERLVEALEGVGLAYQLLGQSDKGEANTGVLTPETFMLRIKSLHPDITDEACMDLYYAIDDDNSGAQTTPPLPRPLRHHFWKIRESESACESEASASKARPRRRYGTTTATFCRLRLGSAVDRTRSLA